MLQVSFTEQIDDQTSIQAASTVWSCGSPQCLQSQQGWAGSHCLGFEASGEQAVSQALLQGNGWVRYLLGPVVSRGLFYQLRLNLGTRILWITLAATAVPLLSPSVPLLLEDRVRRPHKASQRGTVRRLHGIIWSHSRVVCKVSTRQASLKCYSSRLFTAASQGTD